MTPSRGLGAGPVIREDSAHQASTGVLVRTRGAGECGPEGVERRVRDPLRTAGPARDIEAGETNEFDGLVLEGGSTAVPFEDRADS